MEYSNNLPTASNAASSLNVVNKADDSTNVDNPVCLVDNLSTGISTSNSRFDYLSTSSAEERNIAPIGQKPDSNPAMEQDTEEQDKC